MNYQKFTELFRRYRPYLSDYIVTDVNYGSPKDPNIILTATSPDKVHTSKMFIAKDWILDHFDEPQI